MYNIADLSGREVSGQWQWNHSVDWDYLIANKYEGVYIQITHDGKDNPYLAALYDDTLAHGMRVGFFCVLENGSISYAKQMMDLMQKCQARSMSLPPAVVIGGAGLLNRHQFRGDFESYFKAYMVDKFPYVVVGVNKGMQKWMFEADPNYPADNIVDFKTMMTQDKVRLWLYDWSGAELPGAPDPWKYVWIWGKSQGVNVIEFANVTPPNDDVPPDDDTPPDDNTADDVGTIVFLLNELIEKVDKLSQHLGVQDE